MAETNRKRRGAKARAAIMAGCLALAVCPVAAYAAGNGSEMADVQGNAPTACEQAVVRDRMAPPRSGMPEVDAFPDGELPPALPDGEHPVDGELPPALPDGEHPVDGELPPALPDGEHPVDGELPPALPDGELPPALPDGEHPVDGELPPALPDGELPPRFPKGSRLRMPSSLFLSES